MPVPNPTTKIIEAFGASQVAPFIRAIPKTASGLGLASFDLGFPAATMTDPTLGGVPMSGPDMNGILNAISAYAAALQAGQFQPYDAGTSAAIGGYALGALLMKADGSGLWLSLTADNVTDPDTGGAGWTALQPDPIGVLQLAVTTGTYNDYSPAGFNPEIGYLDLSPAGAVIITGIAAPPTDQYLLVTNLSSSNTLTLDALNTGSLAQNRLRLPGNIGLAPNNSICLRYSTQLSLWVQS